MAPQVLSPQGIKYLSYLSHLFTLLLDFHKYSFLFFGAISMVNNITIIMSLLITIVSRLVALEIMIKIFMKIHGKRRSDEIIYDSLAAEQSWSRLCVNKIYET